MTCNETKTFFTVEIVSIHMIICVNYVVRFSNFTIMKSI